MNLLPFPPYEVLWCGWGPLRRRWGRKFRKTKPVTKSDLFAYQLLNERYENANNPQDREAAARGMLLHRLQSGLAHSVILKCAEDLKRHEKGEK